ncbi:MAG: hypothetical protein IPP79_18265 [Chitinophagaceae bacterium]|nr:hypothetical protein [Chitinophagaceae bacterium]
MKVIILLLVLIESINVQVPNVGIEITNPIKAKPEVNGGVGRTVGLFGGEDVGILLQREFPAVDLTSIFDGTSSRHIGNGFALQLVQSGIRHIEFLICCQ